MDYKVRQGLQSTTGWITKCDRLQSVTGLQSQTGLQSETLQMVCNGWEILKKQVWSEKIRKDHQICLSI